MVDLYQHPSQQVNERVLPNTLFCRFRAHALLAQLPTHTLTI